MIVHLPTLKQLQYLVALREHGHFGRAAEACFVTQSTLSAGLRELETLLGIDARRAHPAGGALHPARHPHRGQGASGPARERGAGRHGAGRRPAADRRIADGRDPDHRAVPASGDAAALARREWPEPQPVSARRYQPGGVRGASSRPARLRAAGAALSPAATSIGPTCSTTGCSSPFPHGEAPAGRRSTPAQIDESRLLLLEDGHCLKDHALSACNRPEIRAGATMMGTSLHTLVQMVDNGLGLTFIPQMAIQAGLLDGTRVEALPLEADHGSRQIALAWRRSSPREEEFRLPRATQPRRAMSASAVSACDSAPCR